MGDQVGTIHHHAIVVTDSEEADLKAAHAKAVELGMLVTNITEPGVNGYQSFLVAPDGSKEWWPESYAGNERRKQFMEWLCDPKNPAHVDWVEVSFGELETTAKTVYEL